MGYLILILSLLRSIELNFNVLIMKKIFLAIFISSMIFVSQSCETNLDMGQIQYSDRLVVNALLTTSDIVGVSVSNTYNVFDTTVPVPLMNASVKFIDDNGNQTDLKLNLITGKYEANVVPKAGKKYTILVNHPKYNSAQGELTLPFEAVKNKSTFVDNTALDPSGNPTGTITLNLSDNGNERNYYEINIYRYNDFLDQWFIMTPVTNDPNISENAIQTNLGGILFTDKSFNGKTKTIPFITEYASAGTKYKYLVEIKSLSSPYYQYFQSLQAYENTNSVFSEPNPIYSNIQGGRGICAGASVFKDTIY